MSAVAHTQIAVHRKYHGHLCFKHNSTHHLLLHCLSIRSVFSAHFWARLGGIVLRLFHQFCWLAHSVCWRHAHVAGCSSPPHFNRCIGQFCALYCVFQLAGRSVSSTTWMFLAWPCGLHSYGRICVHGFIFFTGTCVPFQLLNIPLIQAHGMRFVLVFLTIWGFIGSPSLLRFLWMAI